MNTGKHLLALSFSGFDPDRTSSRDPISPRGCEELETCVTGLTILDRPSIVEQIHHDAAQPAIARIVERGLDQQPGERRPSRVVRLP
jgi:hypothetical protein